MMRPGILITLLLLATATIAQETIPAELSAYARGQLLLATDYMNESRYDSAQFIISYTFSQTQFPLNQYDQYYLYMYESEIMYYNALIEQGLNSTMQGMEIAKKFNEPHYIGNCENFLGLFLMNQDKPREAVAHYLRSAQLLPADYHNELLSFRYHALGNLGECYLKLHMPDSAIEYSSLSMIEATQHGRIRGVALAMWNMGEANIMLGRGREARRWLQSSFDKVQGTPHRDIIQTLCASLMKSWLEDNEPDSARAWLDTGLRENENDLNTDFARTTFLQAAVDACIRMNDVKKASQLLHDLTILQKNISSKQQSQRISILRDYYLKNETLMNAQELSRAQQEEIRLRGWILVILGMVAALLVISVVMLRKTFRQRQKIASLEHSEALRKKELEAEIKAVKARAEAVQAERNRISADLHDDMGATLSSIRIYSSAALDKIRHNPSESQSLLKRINDTSVEMMENMSDMVWSITPGNHRGEQLVLRMKAHTSAVFGAMNIRTEYRTDESFDALMLSLQARKNIYLIFKEAVNNIAKYSQAHGVHIRITMAGNQFELEIKDDGSGFDMQVARRGNGLSNMQKRASQLHGDLIIRSTPENGCSVCLTVPLKNLTAPD